MENNFIYYDKTTGRVLTTDEAKAEWELAKQEQRPTNMIVSQAKNLIIEDGYVKQKVIEPVANLIAKKQTQPRQDIQHTSEATVSTQEVNSSTKDAIIEDIIAESRLYPDSTEQFDVDDILTEFREKNPTLDSRKITGVKKMKEEKIVMPKHVETKEDIDNPDYVLQVLQNAEIKRNIRGYDTLYRTSIAPQKELETQKTSYERTGKRKSIKYNTLTKALITIAAVALISSAGYHITQGLDALINAERYNSAVVYLNEQYDDAMNFVNKNKVSIDGQFDSQGHPIYWIDTTKVAEDILEMPDEGYLSSLYLAYNQMGKDRENGPYNNWDDTIGCISSLVDEDHPIAYSTTSGCINFRSFLVKAGYVDSKTSEPSPEMFEKAGRDAVISFANYTKENNPTLGGRI